MMRWNVGEYVFDADTRRLSGGGRMVSLEPKASALLAYFCQHPGRDIGRDELMRNVWHGQIVTDNSINRVVVLLRKALRDDAKARKYIVTVPKLGYRLIAPVSPADKRHTESAEVTAQTIASRPTWHRAVPVLALVAAVLALLWFRPGQTPPTSQATAVAPLSRLDVAQSNAALASNGESLLYTASDGEHRRIFLLPGADTEPRPISADGGNADFANWSNDDSFVVYQFFDGDRCEIHRLSRAAFETRNAEVIYECLPGSYTELSLSPDNATLYFLERATTTAPYAVYALDLERRTKRRLSQPVARGYGNHFVDVHPRRGTLLLLSDHTPGKTSVFELDPADDSFDLLTSFDYSLDSAIWSHREGYIVHPSRHPSYQLLETAIGGADSAVLVSDSRRISGPRRLTAPGEAGHDYLFTSYLYNRDIETTPTQAAGINSAVMDYLPALSHDAQRLAFISKRAGHSQILIKNYETGQLQAIDPPDRGRRFLDLRWSADDRQLLANTNTGVLVYDLNTGGVRRDVAFELPAYAVRWHDANTLSLSHHDNGQWRAFHYKLDTGETLTLDARWAFSLRNDQQEILLDQSLTAFRDGQPVPELSRCANLVWRYQLRVQLDGRNIYCHADDASADVLRFDADMSMTRLPDAVHRFEFFSVRDGNLATTRVASAYSDIMRTRQPAS
ncbi:MAG: winged helix-turn-helix domain-containing protein [Pseudomonadota bacterium]